MIWFRKSQRKAERRGEETQMGLFSWHKKTKIVTLIWANFSSVNSENGRNLQSPGYLVTVVTVQATAILWGLVIPSFHAIPKETADFFQVWELWCSDPVSLGTLGHRPVFRGEEKILADFSTRKFLHSMLWTLLLIWRKSFFPHVFI